jgi:hypothetical protein
MNIRKYIILTATAATIAFTSCTPALKSTSSRTREVNGSILQTPVLADLEVSQTKVTGTASYSGQPVDYVKGMAVADALKNSNADELVEPSYDVETVGTQIKVTVKGFPATYKNFRAASKADTTLMKMALRTSNSAPVSTVANEAAPAAKKKNKAASAVIGVLGGAALLIIILAAGGAL